ncbi:conserved hypothetical protein [Methanosalsum zhilinae DSM 4017]|uniref:HTH arsR-type domain-containing protein n=1 Tax=Methanosalsum zhilinae (strain DSM 4017 / NBRC 107636 / OCM 62 / WeN5) TaxID=679901 RepID=F7XQB2_METZD|nr:hypothetical protein [Methanosalsum zhilinae]AEH61574.1 conserved hypothetical protein [Methanosalsum zhilinae DSM 4017]
MCESETIEMILKNLTEMNEKLDKLIQLKTDINEKSNSEKVSLDVMTLISLPDHLRTTAATLFELGTATADSVAEVTQKERAVESNYLNQLVRMGHVRKQRTGRKVYFSIREN